MVKLFQQQIGYGESNLLLNHHESTSLQVTFDVYHILSKQRS